MDIAQESDLHDGQPVLVLCPASATTDRERQKLDEAVRVAR
jgi:hypothetical protein